MSHMEYLEFIETPTFSRKCKEFLTEEEYRLFQEYLTHYLMQGR